MNNRAPETLEPDEAESDDLVPHNPGRTAAIALSWLDDVEVLAGRFVAQLKAIETYRDGPVAEEELHRSARQSMRLLIHLIADRPIPPEAERVSRDVGHHRAVAGMPLEGVVRAVQLNYNVLWQAILERTPAEELGALAPDSILVWNSITQHLNGVMDAYQETTEELARARQDRRRAAFAGLVLSQGQDQRVVARAAEVLGFREDGNFAVVIAVPGMELELRTRAKKLAERKIRQHLEEAVTGDTLVLELPARTTAIPRGWLGDLDCTVGPVAYGLHELPGALDLAQRASRVRRRGVTGPVYLRSAWLEVFADADLQLTEALVADTLGAVLPLPDDEFERVTGTVLRHLEGTGSVAETAAALFCHRNTVVNRLRRFSELTGLDIRHPEAAAIALLALRASPRVSRLQPR